MGRHVYTFENLCKEDNSIALNDGTTKIFLNAVSDMDDISKELRAFLDYVAGKQSDDYNVPYKVDNTRERDCLILDTAGGNYIERPGLIVL